MESQYFITVAPQFSKSILLTVMTKLIDCVYCNGTGKDPYELLSPISGCQVCKGLGQIEVEEPSIICIYCSGSGKNPLGARVPCIVCHGKGSNLYVSDTICSECNGTGKWSDGLPCTRCKGIGFSK